ncbi:PH domain-containing protein [Desulfothermobacter acidiphilus]|uniref:PH domain-containing protein n=1 Tax=Desulfothermobacter acidiphilus TaxID=1938353 RepID=UPI003F8C8A4F
MWFLVHVFTVRFYRVDERGILVKRPLGGFYIPVHKISSIEYKEKVQVSFKVAASAGYLGYYGRFFSEDDNRTVRVYATNLRDMVRIETTDGKIFYLSPAEPEKFVEAVKQHLQKTEP